MTPFDPLRPQDFCAQLPGPPNAVWPQGARSVCALRHGTLEIKLYAPQGSDPQQPHSRDEVYVVVTGQGVFDNGGVVQAFSAGDALFVPAMREHRFTQFSDNLVCWVMFYGPEGGET